MVDSPPNVAHERCEGAPRMKFCAAAPGQVQLHQSQETAMRKAKLKQQLETRKLRK